RLVASPIGLPTAAQEPNARLRLFLSAWDGSRVPSPGRAVSQRPGLPPAARDRIVFPARPPLVRCRSAQVLPPLVRAGESPAIWPATVVAEIKSPVALGVTVARFSRFDLPTALVPPCSSGNAPSSTISAHRTSTQKATMIGTSMRGRLTRRRAKIVAMLPQSGPVMAVATPTPDRWTPGHWSGALQKTNQLLVHAGFP